jgi:hypothetical protein
VAHLGNELVLELLDALALGDVAHDPDEQGLPIVGGLGDRQFEREMRAVLAASGHFPADADHPRHPRSNVPRQVAVMLATIGLGHQHRHVPSDHLVFRVAEDALRGRAEGSHDTALIDGDDPVEHIVQDRPGVAGLFLERGGCLRAFDRAFVRQPEEAADPRIHHEKREQGNDKGQEHEGGRNAKWIVAQQSVAPKRYTDHLDRTQVANLPVPPGTVRMAVVAAHTGRVHADGHRVVEHTPVLFGGRPGEHVLAALQESIQCHALSFGQDPVSPPWKRVFADLGDGERCFLGVHIIDQVQRHGRWNGQGMGVVVVVVRDLHQPADAPDNGLRVEGPEAHYGLGIGMGQPDHLIPLCREGGPEGQGNECH